MFDLEMIKEIGYCHGIENYARHLTGRAPGEPPPTLLDYLPDDALIIVDESHQTVPQVRGMYHGDRSRKEVLVAYGFRLPSALDNRPLNFEEWEAAGRPGGLRVGHARARTSWRSRRASWSSRSSGRPASSIRRSTCGRSRGRWTTCCRRSGRASAQGERVLVTTLTKRMAEDLTQYYQELGVRVRYLHSDIETLERVEILRDLRRGEFDVLVGINLLREGLDLPEVSLVAILDADKEGFLRSAGSLIQTSGRAARNVNGRVIMYADTMTDSMRARHQRDRAAGARSRRPTTRSTASRRSRSSSDRRGDVERLRARLHDAGRPPSTAPNGSTPRPSSTRTSRRCRTR